MGVGFLWGETFAPRPTLLRCTSWAGSGQLWPQPVLRHCTVLTLSQGLWSWVWHTVFCIFCMFVIFHNLKEENE